MAPPSSPTTHLSVPISVMLSDGGGTRVGDPGVMEDMPTPDNVYVFLWKMVDKATYEFLFLRREGIKDSWTYMDGDAEYDSRYELRDAIMVSDLTQVLDGAGFAINEVIGRSYAIATNVKIPEAELITMVNGLYAGVFDCVLTDDQYHVKGIKEATYPAASLEAKVQGLEMNCSSTAWNKEAFRDLYSSPAKQDGRVDVLGIANGLILYNTQENPGSRELHGDVRLYHTAAKVDFKWEVPASLQDMIAVRKITTTGLPVRCKVFNPTSNPTDAPVKNYIIGSDTEANMQAAINCGVLQPINPGNKWMGREYFYALQPAGGTITYTVDFESVDGITSKAPVNASFTPSVVNDIFTGWYRINATVSN